MPKDSGKPHYLVVNADESEPSTCKDRDILRNEPHKLIEGCLLRVLRWVRMPPISISVVSFLMKARRWSARLRRLMIKACWVRMLPSRAGILMLSLHRGAGAYICGEETALIESIEGEERSATE